MDDPGSETCGPWEIGAYYEVTDKLATARAELHNTMIPADVRPGAAVLCAKAHKRFNSGLMRACHFKDDMPTFIDCARFAYFQPGYGDDQILAVFDIEVGRHIADHTPYLKKITSPLRILALAGSGLVP